MSVLPNDFLRALVLAASERMQQGKTVSLPGVGSLNPYTDPDSGRVSVRFDEEPAGLGSVNPDLASTVASVLGVPVTEVSDRLAGFARAVRSHLSETGSVLLPGIGKLQGSPGQVEFEPEPLFMETVDWDRPEGYSEPEPESAAVAPEPVEPAPDHGAPDSEEEEADAPAALETSEPEPVSDEPTIREEAPAAQSTPRFVQEEPAGVAPPTAHEEPADGFVSSTADEPALPIPDEPAEVPTAGDDAGSPPRLDSSLEPPARRPHPDRRANPYANLAKPDRRIPALPLVLAAVVVVAAAIVIVLVWDNRRDESPPASAALDTMRTEQVVPPTTPPDTALTAADDTAMTSARDGEALAEADPATEPVPEQAPPPARAPGQQPAPPTSGRPALDFDTSASGYTLIVGSTASEDDAYAQIVRFRALELPMAVLAYPEDGGTRFRLAVGRYDSAPSADQARQDMADRLPAGTWVRRIRP